MSKSFLSCISFYCKEGEVFLKGLFIRLIMNGGVKYFGRENSLIIYFYRNMYWNVFKRKVIVSVDGIVRGLN